MKPLTRLDWSSIWIAFDDWCDRREAKEEFIEWKDQQRKIQRLVELARAQHGERV